RTDHVEVVGDDRVDGVACWTTVLAGTTSVATSEGSCMSGEAIETAIAGFTPPATPIAVTTSATAASVGSPRLTTGTRRTLGAGMVEALTPATGTACTTSATSVVGVVVAGDSRASAGAVPAVREVCPAVTRRVGLDGAVVRL